ncbi:MAG: hypothetical protein LBB94_10020 [Clostridiales bacterium]|jgi:hypothetical protein|nr:hypothetical protein [Clostridiales bacterium]
MTKEINLYRAMSLDEFNKSISDRQPHFIKRYKWFSSNLDFIIARVQDGKFNNSNYMTERYTILSRFIIYINSLKYFTKLNYNELNYNELILDRRKSQMVKWLALERVEMFENPFKTRLYIKSNRIAIQEVNAYHVLFTSHKEINTMFLNIAECSKKFSRTPERKWEQADGDYYCKAGKATLRVFQIDTGKNVAWRAECEKPDFASAGWFWTAEQAQYWAERQIADWFK